MKLKWLYICLLLLIPPGSFGQNDTTQDLAITTRGEMFYVTQDDPVMDTVGGLKYRLRIDTLFKYLEKPPSASWEIIWVDGMERADLKRGDILRIIPEDESRYKDYFLAVDTVPETTSNATLSAITWPDIPDPIRTQPGWSGDTIPNFKSQTFLYDLKLPLNRRTVPALVAIPEDINAQVVMDRADSLRGPQQSRTTTFTVTAEDGITQQTYQVVFETGELSDDAMLTSTEYAIDQQGNEGAISGIPVGASIRTVLNNVTLPEGAILHVIKDKDELVPLQVRNYDSTYVNTQATGYIHFEVIAEDGHSKIVYQLKPDIAEDEVYVFSNFLDVDQMLQLITPFPDGINVQTFFTQVKPNVGAEAILVDKIGVQRTRGEVMPDDEVVVTAADGKTQKIYRLSFYEEQPAGPPCPCPGVCLDPRWEDVLGVDQEKGMIWKIQPGLKVSIFMGLVSPRPGDFLYVLDKDSTVVTSGTLKEGYRLKAVNPDCPGEKIYDLYFTEEKPGTQAFVTSDSLMVDEDSKTIGGDAINLEVEAFLELVEPALLATLTVVDADSNVVESGIIKEDFMLKVTSGDNTKVGFYNLLFETAVDRVLKTSGIKVYPNPAHNFITLEGIEKGDQVVIRNILGVVQKIMEPGTVRDGGIPVNDLPPGVYFLFLKKGNDRSNAVKLIITDGY